MKNYVLEVCVDSVESAIAAKNGRATRLELCSDLIIGGTTPSMELFHMVKEKTGLPVHILIRPRFGDFLYSDYEYELMCRQIRSFVAEGADAVVIGSLNSDGSLNMEHMKGMIEVAGGRRITLHRAFDVAKDPLKVLEQARALGVNTILTSGQAQNCYEGRALIADLIKESGNIEILIGGGVDVAVIEYFVREMSATSFHMSGKTVIPSGMEYRNEQVSMGLPGISEYQMWRTNEEAVYRAADMLGWL